MTTIKLTIEYDGSRYPGFSTKKKSTSIESKLTLAIRDVTGQSTQLFAAVKTEPGVHATHQIVSFQLEKESFSDNTELLKMKLSAALPADIAVTSLKIADERFVASLAVKSCTYTCRIATDPAAASCRYHSHSWKRKKDRQNYADSRWCRISSSCLSFACIHPDGCTAPLIYPSMIFT